MWPVNVGRPGLEPGALGFDQDEPGALGFDQDDP
jgi:hypothetical protein